MKNKIYHLTFFTFLIASFFYAEIAVAQYGYFPHQFYGTVTINNVQSPDSVLISAKFNGKDVEGGLTKDGKYGYQTAFVVALLGKYEGDTIEFYVQNVKAAEYPFTPGNSTELNLVVTIPNFCGDDKCDSGETCSSCSNDCGACPSSGGGGGGGGGGGLPSGSTTCVEDWICTDWSECFNSMQKRVCADSKRCGTTEKKPIEQQDCIMPVICEPNKRTCEGDTLMLCSSSGTTWITLQECEFGCSNEECVEKETETSEAYVPISGFFLGLSTTEWLIGIIIGIIVAATIIFLLKRQKKKY